MNYNIIIPTGLQH